MTNFCGACGKALNAETQFCTYCGAAVTPVPSRDAQSTATDVPRASAAQSRFMTEADVQTRDNPRRTWLFVALGAVAAVIVGWIYVSPYLALRSLKQAALDGNIEALKESVDFSALRTSLKEELGGQIARQAVKEIRQDDSGFGVLGSALAGGVVNAMIEEFVTPQVLAELAQGKSFEGTPLASYGRRFSTTPKTGSSENGPTISTGYKSFSEFDVRIFPEKSKAAVTLVLLRSGLSIWRLSGIRLPADMDELMKETNEATNAGPEANHASPAHAVADTVGNAESKVMWTAMSRTAMAVTEDIGLTPSAITIKGTDYSLTLVREIADTDLAEASEIVNESKVSTARLYKVRVPEFCGAGSDAAWMLAVYSVEAHGLSLAFFSGNEEPILNDQTVSTGHNLCGTFAYVS